MDSLSNLLSLLSVRRYYSTTLNAGGRWALKFKGHDGIKFAVVVRGSHWLAVDGESPIELHEGDCFLLTRSRSFVVSSDASAIPVDSNLYAHTLDRNELVWRCGGDDVVLMGGRFHFAGHPAQALLSYLPVAVKIPKKTTEASTLRWALTHFSDEARQPRPGGSHVSGHLAGLMLVEVLRLYLDARTNHCQYDGWFRAMSDPLIAKAITALHTTPSEHWRVDAMAHIAGMSRSAFAKRFSTIVRCTPIEYLTRWRMALASEMLLNTTTNSLASIAIELGYESESALAVAFKRVMGLSPRQYQCNFRHDAMLPGESANN